MKIKRIGVDLAKNVFQLHGVDHNEQVTLQLRLKRANWLKVLLDKTEPGCEIGMEACTGAHHWGRLLQAKGYRVKLIAPQFVKPYVKSNKNDANDAAANAGLTNGDPAVVRRWEQWPDVPVPQLIKWIVGRPQDPGSSRR